MRDAQERCSFQLTYARALHQREFDSGEISGEMIDDAYHPGRKSPGDWSNGLDTPEFNEDGSIREDVSFEEWVEHFFSMAVSEGVHEVLEWFQFDGEPWLDPHGKHDQEISVIVSEFAKKLIALHSKN